MAADPDESFPERDETGAGAVTLDGNASEKETRTARGKQKEAGGCRRTGKEKNSGVLKEAGAGPWIDRQT